LLINQTESNTSPVPPDTLKSRKTFWIFLGVVLVSRLIIWTLIPEHPQSFLEIDSPSYTDPAEALIADGSYNTEPGSETPETLRPPGYPVWLALIFLLFGKSAQAVVFSQVFLFLGTLVLTYVLTEKMFGSRPAWAAVILLALDPSSLSYTFKILTETLTAFLTILFAYCAFRFYQSKGKFHFGVGAGLSLALVTLVRPTTYYFIPFLIIAFMIFLIREKVGWKKILSGLVVTLLPILILVGGWQWRNLEAAGMLRLASVQGWALYLGKGAQIYSEKHQTSLNDAETALIQRLKQNYPDWNQISMEQLDDIYLVEGWKLVRENPGLAVKAHVLHMFYFFLAPGTTSAFFRTFDPGFKSMYFNWYQKAEYFGALLKNYKLFLVLMMVGAAYLAIMYAGIASWMAQTWRNSGELMGKGCHIFFLLLILYIAGASSINYGQDRYRVVVMPLLCMYAGAGYPAFLSYLRTLKWWPKRAE
jgi:4-amino-4-deoxy-L-arabinose transferase-like glycosyltransferase